MSTVIAGFGNELRADDGVGLAVIRHIERGGVPEGVRCAEVGIGGIAMLHELLTEVVNDLEIGMDVVTHNRLLASRADRVLLLEGGTLSETVVGDTIV